MGGDREGGREGGREHPARGSAAWEWGDDPEGGGREGGRGGGRGKQF